MARMYNEYISVDSDFIPVFSRHSDRDFPNKWKSFYPHDSFKSIVSQLVDTLEMNSIEKNKSLWMSGAYGTGKTFASFVIKHLLEDRLDDIRPYFEANNMMPIYARISGIRSKGKVMVVHRSSSASIVGNNRLFNIIMESIKISLKENEYTYLGQKSQFDTVLSTLKDPNSSFDFSKAFERHKAKFTEYASYLSVIRDLEELDINSNIDLLQTIVDVAEEEHYVWSTTVDNLIEWINDVVKGNQLYAIVFIWDEFTEFFKNNQNNITGLQEIAHASASINFYFFLIAHKTSEIINDKDARKIIEARFKMMQIEMADTTAFKLMGQAIKHNLDLEQEWEKEVLDLWNKVEKSTKNTIIKNSEDIKETELKSLLPLHPYAAYLLKIISKDISSNQRTMFQFLSGDYNDGDKIKTNFKWFIENNYNDLNQWSFLTADYIWDYFITDENMDLDSTFKNIISHYNNYVSICENDENMKKVLKVALLLTAMQQKSGASRSRGLSGLLRPTLTNIAACFVGTPIQSSINILMAIFVSKNVFGKVEEGNDTLYVPPLGNIDEEKFNEMKEILRKQLTFEKILTDETYSIYERFLPTDYLKFRYSIYPITPNDYKNTLEKVLLENVNKIPMLFMFVKNEIDQSKVKSTIDRIINSLTRPIILVDFTSLPLMDGIYEKFLHSKTEEKYYGNPNQRAQSELAKRNAKDILNEWKNKLDMTSLDIYCEAGQVKKCQGGLSLRRHMQEINSSIFPHGLEVISKNDKLFTETGFKDTVAQMGMSKISIPGSYSYLNQISNKLVNDGIWNNLTYVNDNPVHSVSQMKCALDTVISDKFKKNSMIEVSEIWTVLERQPFGLLSCSGSVYLLGFLLKEYADSVYYKYDGANTVSLNYSDLSELIYGVVKGLSKVKNQFIIKQTPEHREFCKITGNIFKIARDKQNSIDDISKNINLFLKSNEYPLWCLKYYLKEEYADHEELEELQKIINLFCEFISSNLIAGRDKTKIADDIYKIYKTIAGINELLEKIIKVGNLKQGMEFYLATYKYDLIHVIKRLNISTNESLMALTKKLSADSSYLWGIGDTNHQIDNLYEDYKLIDAANNILTEKKNTIDNVVKAVRDKLNLIKLPDSMLIKERPDLESILRSLYAIKNASLISKSDIVKTLETKSDDFNMFFNSQFGIFSIAIRNEIECILSDDELGYLFDNIESGALYISTDKFMISINNELEKYRKNKIINKLYALWKEITDSNSPAEWSKNHTIPILCLFQSDSIQASKVFDLINKTRTASSESEIVDAIAFINDYKMNILLSMEKCDILFKEYFCGEYSYIIDNIDELKNTIELAAGKEVYEWYAKKMSIDNYVKKLAYQKYDQTYKPKVKEKIKQLSPEKAQKYLQELIEDKPLVGINILKN